MHTENCPDRWVLRQFQVGVLPCTDRQWIEEHLRICDVCRTSVETVVSDDAESRLHWSEVPQNSDEGKPEGDLDETHHVDRALESDRPAMPVDAQMRPTAGKEIPRHVSRVAQEIDFLRPPELPDELGRLGDYRVLEVLGVGGMGVVFRAEDTKLRRDVALKAMRPSIATSNSAKNRFLKEAEATAAIEHDHIVTIYQIGEDRGIPFIAMRYLRGESLEKRLRREGKLDQREVVRLGRQIALGLAAAHERGLIHRDIKPDNIWLDATDDRVKIVDFGLVRSTLEDSELTRSGFLVGTPRYMAPEQARGEAADHRSDLFSLGSVLYRTASGVAPFAGPNLTATLLAVAQADATPIQSVCGELHPDLASLIMRLLAREPEQRPRSAAEVAAALEAISGQFVDTAVTRATSATLRVPTEHRSETSTPTNSRSAARRPWLKKIFGLALVSLLAIASFGGAVVVVAAKGTVIVNTSGELADDVKIEVLNGGSTVAILEKNNHWRIKLDRGQYSVKLSGGDDHFVLQGNRLTVSRFGRHLIDVTYVDSDSGRTTGRDSDEWNPDDYVRDQAAGEWVLKHRGKVTIATESATELEITTPGQLPEPPFKLLGARFENSPALRGDELEVLTNLPALWALWLRGCKIGAGAVPYLARCPDVLFLHLNDTDLKTSDFTMPIPVLALDLSVTQVDDNWSFLEYFPQLRQLALTDCHLLTTGQGWSRFANLHTLLLGTRGEVPPSVIEEIKAANPHLKIETRKSWRVGVIVEPNPVVPTARSLTQAGYLLEGVTRQGAKWFADAERFPTGELYLVTVVTLPQDRAPSAEQLARIPELTWAFQGIVARRCVQADSLAKALQNRCTIGWMDLSDSDLTDDGLLTLAHIRHINRIKICGTRVAESAVRDFKRINPKCVVESNFGEFGYRHRMPD